jgi:hypothetical protein
MENRTKISKLCLHKRQGAKMDEQKVSDRIGRIKAFDVGEQVIALNTALIRLFETEGYSKPLLAYFLRLNRKTYSSRYACRCISCTAP